MSTESDKQHIDILRAELNWQHDVVIPDLEDRLKYSLQLIIKLNTAIRLPEYNPELLNIIESWVYENQAYLNEPEKTEVKPIDVGKISDDLPF